MQVKFSDDVSHMQGGPLTLIRLGPQWHVVGRGYLCAVENKEEGAELIMLLRAFRVSRDSSQNNSLDVVLHSP